MRSMPLWCLCLGAPNCYLMISRLAQLCDNKLKCEGYNILHKYLPGLIDHIHFNKNRPWLTHCSAIPYSPAEIILLIVRRTKIHPYYANLIMVDSRLSLSWREWSIIPNNIIGLPLVWSLMPWIDKLSHQNNFNWSIRIWLCVSLVMMHASSWIGRDKHLAWEARVISMITLRENRGYSHGGVEPLTLAPGYRVLRVLAVLYIDRWRSHTTPQDIIFSLYSPDYQYYFFLSYIISFDWSDQHAYVMAIFLTSNHAK